uniref:Uncharacterized protein n=1 Tax=Arundo donax TaxID=35708 RepID=A0A0A9H9V2_ARUDO
MIQSNLHLPKNVVSPSHTIINGAYRLIFFGILELFLHELD